MGKTTGFIEFAREEEAREAPDARLRHWHEFVPAMADPQARTQSARCMDCGIPFCSNGCPVHNLIPEFNDLVWKGRWREALERLHATNNFPEFTGRLCPAPCEASCTLGINQEPVSVKAIEQAIIDRGWSQGWVTPQPPGERTGHSVAIVGSGPAGLAAAQQLARAGHAVTVLEKNARPGGLLRYGIPDFKLDKSLVDRRLEQMAEEGVRFICGVDVGSGAGMHAPTALLESFDAVLLAIGAEQPRDLPIPGRELAGIEFAMDFLVPQNRRIGCEVVSDAPSAAGKHVVVIGGGDTGSDCVGTANRQGASGVTQIELLPRPPEHENKPLVWPYWPVRVRTSSSHEEGCSRDWALATQAFLPSPADSRQVGALRVVRVEWLGGRMREVAGTEAQLPADLVLLALGFAHPRQAILDAFGVECDGRGNAKATTRSPLAYATSVPRVYACGDVRRGQSLVVWAIREGREAARAINLALSDASATPGLQGALA